MPKAKWDCWVKEYHFLHAQALRSPTFQFVQKLEKLRLEFMGDDLDRTGPQNCTQLHWPILLSRIVRGFWQRMPDGTEALQHSCKFKHKQSFARRFRP